jgi:hypothetical protein
MFFFGSYENTVLLVMMMIITSTMIIIMMIANVDYETRTNGERGFHSGNNGDDNEMVI